MSSTENLNFTKHTIWALFGVNVLSKTEVYTENSTEGEPFKIIVNQEYFNKEFDLNDNKGNDKKS